jgi:hypothetical protein
LHLLSQLEVLGRAVYWLNPDGTELSLEIRNEAE